MEYDLKRNKTKEPSLTQMTEFAINTLKQNENGFVLLVEGKNFKRYSYWIKKARTCSFR